MTNNASLNTYNPWILIHGLGQNASAWDPVLQQLPSDLNAKAIDLYSLLPETPLTWLNLYRAFERELCKSSQQVNVCGISLGAVLAIQYALQHSDRVQSLILIAPQYKMPKALLTIQNLIFSLTPKSSFESTGLSKANMIGLCNSMKTIDFTSKLSQIQTRTTILCGANDKANLKAAQKLNSLLPHSKLQIIPGAGHDVLADQPEAVSQILLIKQGATHVE